MTWRLVGIKDSETRWVQIRLGIKDSGTKSRWDQKLGFWDRRLRINDSLGSKTILDRRLVGMDTGLEIEDWDR